MMSFQELLSNLYRLMKLYLYKNNGNSNSVYKIAVSFPSDKITLLKKCNKCYLNGLIGSFMVAIFQHKLFTEKHENIENLFLISANKQYFVSIHGCCYTCEKNISQSYMKMGYNDYIIDCFKHYPSQICHLKYIEHIENDKQIPCKLKCDIIKNTGVSPHILQELIHTINKHNLLCQTFNKDNIIIEQYSIDSQFVKQSLL